MRIFITGIAGFIGYHVARKFAEQGETVLGLDNINSYYDVHHKYKRLKALGFHSYELSCFKPVVIRSEFYNQPVGFIHSDITHKEYFEFLLKEFKPDVIIHLAAQPGVRFSIENPLNCFNNNILGFFNILETVRKLDYKPHLIFASSSSVYGNKELPMKESDNTDFPISFYAASKKSNELTACSYSKVYDMNITGLRFFTVYGEYGRPDMAVWNFVNNILNDKPITLFNNGNCYRDFTYIDDIVDGILKVAKKESNGYDVYNLGRGKPVKIKDLISIIETACNKKAQIALLPRQKGDVDSTHADMTKFNNKFGEIISTDCNVGIKNFVDWFRKNNISI